MGSQTQVLIISIALLLFKYDFIFMSVSSLYQQSSSGNATNFDCSPYLSPKFLASERLFLPIFNSINFIFGCFIFFLNIFFFLLDIHFGLKVLP